MSRSSLQSLCQAGWWENEKQILTTDAQEKYINDILWFPLVILQTMNIIKKLMSGQHNYRSASHNRVCMCICICREFLLKKDIWIYIGYVDISIYL